MNSKIKRIWPYLVSAGSASLMILAFFIPSIQDQWDRYQSRKVIQQYVVLGDSFVDEDRFEMAEQAYTKAFELSEEKRLDIEMKRLHAKISRISLEPEWGSKPPDDLTEVDFQFLLHLQTGEEHLSQRVSTLNSYGIFLSSMNHINEAEEAFREALRLDSTDVLAYVNYANLLDQQNKKKEAEDFYLKAIQIDPQNGRAHYNLGLLYVEQGKQKQAMSEFEVAIKLDSTDIDAIEELGKLKSMQPEIK
jgi:tetratricopeptide (TPR) repeat protein